MVYSVLGFLLGELLAVGGGQLLFDGGGGHVQVVPVVAGGGQGVGFPVSLDRVHGVLSLLRRELLPVLAGELVIDAGVHRASSIKVAEAAKVVENSQRDINIAFINELAMAFDRMGIDTNEVIDAMDTKWNALGFRPGLVGGHCIGVDPYYFVYEAEKKGYHSQIVSSGRRVNDDMPTFVAEKIIHQLVLAGKKVREARILFLGITFKENTPDVRNSKITEVADALKQYGLRPRFCDPYADREEVSRFYGYELEDPESVRDLDCVVLGVAHDKYRALGFEGISGMFDKDLPAQERVIIDIKGLLNRDEVDAAGYVYWRL